MINQLLLSYSSKYFLIRILIQVFFLLIFSAAKETGVRARAGIEGSLKVHQ